jgi:hypothetical protein
MVQPKYSPEEALNKIKLMMNYDSSTTLRENQEKIKSLIKEDDVDTDTEKSVVKILSACSSRPEAEGTIDAASIASAFNRAFNFQTLGFMGGTDDSLWRTQAGLMKKGNLDDLCNVNREFEDLGYGDFAKKLIDELDDETYRLYRFINNMVTPNINIYELTSSRGKKIKASNELVKEIIVHLERIFNCSGYKFFNLKLIDQIVYYENPRGKELESFNFSSDVTYHNKSIGSVVINIESFLREDKFYQNHMKSGYLTITNIRLTNRIHPNGVNKEKKIVSGYKLEYSLSPSRNQSKINKPINPTKNQHQAIERNNKNMTKMNESFNNHFVPRENFDELFIRPQSNSEAFMNDTDNSLIPTIDEISSEEYS